MEAAPGTALHPLTGVIRPDRGHAHVERAMPAAAVLWMPLGQPAGDPVYPILLTQAALAAVHAHLARSAGAASFGFLVGDVYLAPDTGLPYVIGDSTVDVPWSIAGDHLKSALLQGREIATAEARRRGGRLIGWYHCHVAPDARLSGADVEAHHACFDDPWQVALVVAHGVGRQGGVFRVGPDGLRPGEYLPFYELPDGTKTAGLEWANYRSQSVALASAIVSPPSAAQPLVLMPDEGDLDDDVASSTPVRAGPGLGRFLATPTARRAGWSAVGLVALGALFAGYRALSARPAERAEPGTSVAALAGQVEQLADSTAFAITAFNVRVRLFENRRMVCTDLARGLVDVESRWTEYNVARAIAGTTLGGARAAMDERLHADVSGVELRFARAGCARP
jgi:hypothetical protein